MRVWVSDILLLTVAYVGAFAVRMQFSEPLAGWQAAAVSGIWVVSLQSLLLFVARLNCHCRWRVRGCDLPRYIAAFAVVAGVLVVARMVFPSHELAWMRPPYSVTLIDMVFSFCAVVGFRFLRERYCTDHSVLTLENVTGKRSRMTEHAQWLSGKVVMVTGAGGSIGSEIVRQVVAVGAQKVLMVERGENPLYKIDHELRNKRNGTKEPCAVPLMVDINDREKMEAIFAHYQPNVVFHAAAYKHVPMCEYNADEARRNNTEATRRLAEMARSFGVEKLIFISTDKAVNPTSVMGRTKRDAEKFVLAAGYCVVRFGNVFGSSGSVIELWRDQISKGGPVTVTDKRMTRYFMSIQEAVGLVIAAGTLESGYVYVLDMGNPIPIVEMAEQMIKLSGYVPYDDIPIQYVGIRPGEKLHEELGLESASAVETSLAKIYRIKRECDAE